MEAILDAKGLNKRYEGFSLRDISLSMDSGSILGIFGPNGAGKTTLIKLLAGQIAADSGEVRLFGLGYDESEVEIKNRIGYCPQEPPFYPDNTVAYTARFAARFFRGWDEGEWGRLLDRFRIFPEKKFRHLSGGQKTLVSLSLAFAHHPDLLLLDEPAAGLDDANRRFLFETLRAFVAGGERAAVVCSHVSDGLDEVAERVLFIDRGAAAACADKEELLARWKWIHFRSGALDHSLVSQLASLRHHPFGSAGLCSDFPAWKEKLAGPVAAGDVKVENARLSDVLVHLTQGG